MNSTEKTTQFPTMLIAFITLQQLVFVVSLAGNSVVIFIFTRKLRMKTNTDKFIVNLAVSDLLCGAASHIQIYYFLLPDIVLYQSLCFLRYQIVAFTTQVSQLTGAFVAFDRFIAICHPHRYMQIMTSRTTWILCVVQWIVPLTYQSLPFVGVNVWYSGMPCIYNFIFPRRFYLFSALIVNSFSAASFVMYIFILKVAWRYYARIKPMITTTDADITKKSYAMERDVRGAKVTGVVTLIFTFCWLPYLTFPLLRGIGVDFKDKPDIQTVATWLVFLGMLNCIMNPFIYALQRPDFRSSCRKTFCCTPRKT